MSEIRIYRQSTCQQVSCVKSSSFFHKFQGVSSACTCMLVCCCTAPLQQYTVGLFYFCKVAVKVLLPGGGKIKIVKYYFFLLKI